MRINQICKVWNAGKVSLRKRTLGWDRMDQLLTLLSWVTHLPFIPWNMLKHTTSTSVSTFLDGSDTHLIAFLCCLPLQEDLQITYAFHCGGDNTVSLNVLCPKQPESGKKKLPLRDSVALYTELTSLLACGVLRRDPGKIKTDSCRMNVNIKIGARRSLLQMEYRDMPLTFCCWTCLPPWIGKQQRQQSAALFSYPTGSLL